MFYDYAAYTYLTVYLCNSGFENFNKVDQTSADFNGPIYL